MKTRKFELTTPNVKYAADLFEAAGDDSVWSNMRDSFPKTLEAWEIRLNELANLPKEKGIYRVILVDEKAVGMVGVKIGRDVRQKTATISYWLASEYWGGGISTNGVKTMCEFMFKNYDIARIEATPYAYNLGSRRVLEKAGFHLEGVMENSVFKNGDLYDSCMYALVKTV